MSMKTNELRIGNYVKGIGHKISWLVEGIEPEYIYSSKAWRTINSFEGIPLTREWVVKLGFKCVWGGSGEDLVFRYGEYCKTMDLIQRSVFKYCLPVGSCELKIEYVHQLQNLYFALTGDELTIQC